MADGESERWIVRRSIDLAGTLAAALGPTVAGLMTGDPALVAGAGGGILGAIQGIRNDRSVEMLRHMFDEMRQDVDRLKAATSNPELADLIGHGLEVAPECRSRDQVRQCARIVADGLDQNATTEQRRRAHLLLDLLRQLHDDHLTVIKYLAEAKSEQLIYRQSPVEMRKELPGLAEVLDQLLTWLVSLGLVRNVGESRISRRGELSYAGLAEGKVESETRWDLTEFGYQLVANIDRPPSDNP